MAYQVHACQAYVEPNMYLYTPLELFTKLSKTSVRVYGVKRGLVGAAGEKVVLAFGGRHF